MHDVYSDLFQLIESKAFDMSSSILQLPVDIAFSIVVLSVNTCSVVGLSSWSPACDSGNALFMSFHVLSVRIMVSTFLNTDRSTISVTFLVCVCVCVGMCVCVFGVEGRGGGGELASGSYIPAFPQLLLFFSFAPAFDTSSLSKGGPISSGLMVVAVSSEENNSLKNSAVKFTCPSSNPTIFPSLSLMTSGFFRCF